LARKIREAGEGKLGLVPKWAPENAEGKETADSVFKVSQAVKPVSYFSVRDGTTEEVPCRESFDVIPFAQGRKVAYSPRGCRFL
jgi:hypothetical protein